MAMAGSGRGINHEMNVTPMIDILLVLLIIFMTIMPSSGLKAVIPQPSDDPRKPPDDGMVVMQLSPASSPDDPPQVKLNQQPVAWKELPDTLTKIYLKRTNKSAFLKADGELDFQQVASVIDIANKSGVESVGLMTKEAGTVAS